MLERKRKIKLYDLVNIHETEVKLAIIFTAFTIFILVYLQIYNNFSLFEERFSSILEMLSGGLIGLLGFSISGIAIIVTLFTKEETYWITKLNGENSIERILGSYKFLSLSLAVEVICFVIIDISLSSDKKLIEENIFWFIILIIVYHLYFNLFYLVALINNCIELYKIKRIYGELEKRNLQYDNNKDDVRIDFIMATLLNICNCTQEELYSSLKEFVERSSLNYDEKEKVLEYLMKKYGNNQ